jgi:hypothetical protein
MKVKKETRLIEYETGIKSFPIINVVFLNETKYFLEVRSIPPDRSFVIFKDFSVLVWGLALIAAYPETEGRCFDNVEAPYENVLKNITEEKLVDLSARTLTVDLKGKLYYDANCFSPYQNILNL